MKKTISYYIFSLLKHNDCVIVTGFGGFILNEKSAFYNELTKTAHPPSKVISFNQRLTQNDGLLANYIAKCENISYNEACVEILKYSRKLKLELSRNKSISLPNIGDFYFSEFEKIEFKANNEFNFNKDSFGLRTFQINKINRKSNKKLKKYAAAAVILVSFGLSFISVNNNITDEIHLFNLNPVSKKFYQPRFETNLKELGKETPGIYNVQVSQVDFDLYKINGTNYHLSTKKCFKLGFGRDVQIKIWLDEKDRVQRQLCFLNVSETEYDDCYKVLKVYNQIVSKSDKIVVLTKRGKMREVDLVLEESYIDPYVIANSSQDIEEQEEIINFNDNIGKRFVDAIQSVSSPKKVKINEPETLITKNNRNVFIIVGSFTELNNAHALTKQLKNRGFPNTKVIEKSLNGLFRVSVDDFYTEDEAKIAVEQIKKQISSAWILNEN
jgi:nucleoid DNA-binding protein